MGSFRYRAMAPGGGVVAGALRAASAAEALRQLDREGLATLELRPGEAPGARAATPAERALLLRQLAVMLKAGTPLDEALAAAGAALAGGRLGREIEAAAAALRRGERIAAAFAGAFTGYPPYVFALIAAGEAGGDLAGVLAQAADELAAEARMRREALSALTYPAFLVAAGAAVTGFLLTVVIPRFAAIVGDRADALGGLPGLVLGLARLGPLELALAAAAAGIAVVALVRAARTPGGRARLLGWAEAWPAAGALIGAAQRARWARVLAFALDNGLDLLAAANLARDAAGAGRFAAALAGAAAALRAGRPPDAAFGPALAPIDVSLLRAGQRAGALAPMLRAIAERHEADLKDGLKRFATVLEQAAIAGVALGVGLVALALVSAITGVYETLG